MLRSKAWGEPVETQVAFDLPLVARSQTSSRLAGTACPFEQLAPTDTKSLTPTVTFVLRISEGVGIWGLWLLGAAYVQWGPFQSTQHSHPVYFHVLPRSSPQDKNHRSLWLKNYSFVEPQCKDYSLSWWRCLICFVQDARAVTEDYRRKYNSKNHFSLPY